MWLDAGILDRELSIYKNHTSRGIKVTILSFGRAKDHHLVKQYNNIQFLTNKWNFPTWLYAVFIPCLFWSTLSNVHIFKSNQMYGAHIVVWCKLFFRAKVILRQGYDFVKHAEKERTNSSLVRWLLLGYERLNFYFSDAAVFTTKNMLVTATSRCTTLPSIVRVIPNYVDQEMWYPFYKSRDHVSRIRMVYFGRFVAQKNLDHLIRAAESLPVQLVFIGDGDEREELEHLASHLGVDVEFIRRLPQIDLAKQLRLCDCFVLPSLYEGNPKALIEVMSFGMPVLTTVLEEQAEFIEPNINCIQMTPTVEGLRTGLETFLGLSNYQRDQLGLNAQNSIQEKHSVENIAALENSLFRDLLSDYGKVSNPL